MERDDLIRRLRKEADAWAPENGGAGGISRLLTEAADAIEELKGDAPDDAAGRNRRD